MEDDANQVKTVALLIIAEKAMRDSSNTNAPQSCWGCVEPHLFSQFQRKNNKTVIARSQKKLETWKAEGGNPQTLIGNFSDLKANNRRHTIY
jgi:hypothetical protein